MNIVVWIDDLDAERSHDLQFRVFPDFEVQAVYHQQFTVTWYGFYSNEAP